jgi:hypothetical protein
VLARQVLYYLSLCASRKDFFSGCPILARQEKGVHLWRRIRLGPCPQGFCIHAKMDGTMKEQQSSLLQRIFTAIMVHFPAKKSLEGRNLRLATLNTYLL